jgi:ribosomal protein S26
MKECKHREFDWTQTAGVGYVRCSSCSKHIPIEQAVSTLDDRLRSLERAMDIVWKLTVNSGEEKPDGE